MMMRLKGPRRLCAVGALLAALALAGPSSATAPVYWAPVPGHECAPTNYYMQCAKGAAGQLPSMLASPLGFAPLFGIDFGWGGPPGAAAHAWGVHEAISYLSYDARKDWSATALHAYRAAGVAVGFVWETTQYRPLGGCEAGEDDAAAANAAVNRLGFPGAVVFAAADFDTSAYSPTGVVGSYFSCFGRRLGYARAGAYGGLRTMQIAVGRYVRWGWQTLAWSYGAWSPAACLRQYAIDQNWHGYGVDFNAAVCGNWGQYAPSPPPPPPPPRRTRCFGPHAALHNPHCQATRANVRRWSRARDASLRALVRADCLAATISRPSFRAAPVFRNRANCGTFRQRVGHFAQLVHKNLY